MNIKIEIHPKNYDLILGNIQKWKISNDEKKDVLKFLKDYELGKVNKGKKVSKGRLCKCIWSLKIPLEYWNKPISKLSNRDIENFEKDFSSDKIKTKEKKNYAISTKADIKKSIKIYFKWKLGEAKATELVGWLDTRVPHKTPEFLTEEEITRLYKGCKNAKERYIISVLFDSGARAEEFMNIRFEDIFIPNSSTNFVKIALKEEYSKTKGRTISLYWKNSLEAIADYVRERKSSIVKANEPVIEGKYDHIRMFLQRLGLRILKKNVHPHLFRHSSATHYASKMNRQQLCIRYGWAFSSDMPDVYITRAGMNDKELDDKMAGTEMEKIKEDYSKREQEWKIKQEKVEEELKNINKKFEELLLNEENIEKIKRVLEIINKYEAKKILPEI